MLQPSIMSNELVTGFSKIHLALTISGSTIHGKGIFTRSPLPPGTFIFDVVAEEVYCENNPTLAAMNQNWIGAGLNKWLKVQPGDLGSYLNHSCRPNIMMDDKFAFYTISTVHENEELLLDYSTTELDPYWQLKCNCGSQECRSIITSFQFLPTGLKVQYLPNLSPFLKQEVESMYLHQLAG